MQTLVNKKLTQKDVRNKWKTEMISSAAALSQYLFKLGSYILKINKQFLIHNIIYRQSQDDLL